MKSSKIDISIIMPVLNGMPYFPQALDSIINQTFSGNLEILIIDGGSDDGTIQYIERMLLIDNRIQLIPAEKKSMGHQYNLGILHASGTYIGFCESDDYWEKGMMEKLFAAVKTYNNPDFVKSDFYMFIKEGQEELKIKYAALPTNRRDLYERLVSLQEAQDLIFRDVNMWNGIYKKEFLQKNNVQLNETPGAAFQDADFIQQVLLHAKGIYIRGACYHYRRDNEASSVYKDTSIFALQELEYMIHYMSNNPGLRSDFGELIIDRLFSLFSSTYGRNRYMKMSDDLEVQMEHLRQVMKDYLSELSDTQRHHLYKNEQLLNFLGGTDLFARICEYRYQYHMKQISDFRKIVEKNKAVVIFGVGELGQSCCAMMRKNHYQGQIAFCDNAEAYHGSYLLGCAVYSVSQAAQIYSEDLFIIPSNAYLHEMKGQLMQLGIARKQIAECTFVIPHTSMEIDWNKTGEELQ